MWPLISGEVQPCQTPKTEDEAKPRNTRPRSRQLFEAEGQRYNYRSDCDIVSYRHRFYDVNKTRALWPRLDWSQMLKAKFELEAIVWRPRPKFWLRYNFGFEVLTSLITVILLFDRASIRSWYRRRNASRTRSNVSFRFGRTTSYQRSRYASLGSKICAPGCSGRRKKQGRSKIFKTYLLAFATLSVLSWASFVLCDGQSKANAGPKVNDVPLSPIFSLWGCFT